MLKKPKIRDRKHLMHIAQLPCVLCLSPYVQSAHLRHGNGAGIALKPADNKTLPLCYPHHAMQHEYGDEKKWWSYHGGYEQANNLADALYANTGDLEAGEQLVINFNNNLRGLK